MDGSPFSDMVDSHQNKSPPYSLSFKTPCSVGMKKRGDLCEEMMNIWKRDAYL